MNDTKGIGQGAGWSQEAVGAEGAGGGLTQLGGLETHYLEGWGCGWEGLGVGG